MKRAIRISGLIATSMLAACAAHDDDRELENAGEASGAVITYAPTDPLGPVISTTPTSAPGASTAGLDSVQLAFLANGKLRRRLDGGPNSVHYENLALQSTAPTDTQIAFWATGAVKLAGFAPPATLRVTRYRTTSTTDGLGHTIPSVRVWDLQFQYGSSNIAIAAANCRLIAPVGSTTAMLTCRLPYLTAVPTFPSFTATVAQADTAAPIAASMPSTSRVTSYRYYEFVGTSPQARHAAVVTHGDVEKRVLLNGGTTTLAVGDNTCSLNLVGWDTDFALAGPHLTTAYTPIGVNQTTHVDSAKFNSSAGANCGDMSYVPYPHGVVICANDAAAAVGMSNPVLGVLSMQDYTGLLNITRWTILGNAPAIPFFGDPSYGNPTQTGYYTTNGGVFHSDIQAFHMIGQLEQFYGAIGMTTWQGVATDPDNGQDEYRLEVTTHYKTDPTTGSITNNAFGGLNLMLLGDFMSPALYNSYAFEPNADPTIIAHEYNHHVTASLAVKKNWADMPVVPACGNWHKNMVCPRTALDEGLSDAFGNLFSLGANRTYTSTIWDPSVTANPCADTLAYPDNPTNNPSRNACNSVAYNYWTALPDDDFIPSNPQSPYEVHRRGSVIFHASYTFQERLRRAGFGPYLAGELMLQAESMLDLPTDDERVYLDSMLGVMPAVAQTRVHSQLLQAAFAEKNVFPKDGGAKCDTSTGCTAAQGFEISKLSLAIATDLAAPTSAPEFTIMAPKGNVYKTSVDVQFSANTGFVNSPFGAVTTISVPVPPTANNNSPPGFFRWTPPSATWSSVVTAASGSPKVVYYRVSQCQPGDINCTQSWNAASSSATAPYVTIAVSATGNCSMGRGDGGGNGALWTGLAFTALALARARRAKRA
jgi:hypothetical protein